MSYSEGGNAKNVANFGKIIIEVDQLGISYNPSNPKILLTALQAKETECQLAMTEVTGATIPLKNAVNAREEGYEGMGDLAIRVKSALTSSGASPAIIKDAKGIVNKILGRRTGKKKDPDPNNPEGGSISVSQMSFDNRKANFELLIALLKGEGKYNPNEADLKVTALEAYIASLAPLNEAVNTTLTNLQNKRMERDVKLYGPEFSMSELTSIVKAYAKSLLGAKSDVYKRIAKIRIIKPKK